jgi:nucleotide-binding universal stress UspA family protein
VISDRYFVAGEAACYRASMEDGWRVCIEFGVLPRRLHSLRQALISELGSRVGDQVAVSSRRWGTEIFLYAPSAGSADEAAQAAREVLARRDVSAPVRTEFWSPRDQQWRDAADEPSFDPVAERQALHEARQERERQASVTFGRPAREVWVELASHDDVVHLAAQGSRVSEFLGEVAERRVRGSRGGIGTGA